MASTDSLVISTTGLKSKALPINAVTKRFFLNILEYPWILENICLAFSFYTFSVFL